MKCSLITIAVAVAIVLLCGHCLAAPVWADEVVFSEDFSTDLHQWQPTRDQGTAWTISDGRADVTLSTSYTISELIPRDEFWGAGWQDLEYSLDYTPLLGVDRNISFNVEDLNNWYEIHFVDTFFNLVRVQNGQHPFDVFYPYVMENGQTYRIKIRFTAGLIKVFSNEVLIAQEYDVSFNHHYGKIGIKVSTGAVFPTRVQFDNIQVKLLSETSPLEVPRYKQNDPAWGSLEYDTAHLWSGEPTMTRWGCALTSAVMILRYHGINWLPDGRELNPGTLNYWLKAQTDGYLGQGLLNWLAITRLTTHISQQHSTPKLEYSRTASDLYDQVSQIFAAQEPAILEIPGHFVVGSGLTNNLHDMWITDPYYDYQKLSQHSGAPISLRRLKPSHTDLSYLLVTTTAPITMYLVDAHSQFIPEVTVFNEFLSSTEATEVTATLQVLLLPKPSSQTYYLYIPPANNLPYELTIYHYDLAANVIQQQISGIANDQWSPIPIEYHKEVAVANWLQLQQQLVDLFAQGNFSRYLSYYHLLRIVRYASVAGPSQQLRYTSLLFELLNTFQNTLSPESYQKLSELLAQLQTILIASRDNS